MLLSQSVTISPAGHPPRTLFSLDVMLHDNADRKVVAASIFGANKRLTLWGGSDYDEAGDYTQAEAEARILELLGPDIKAGLERLFG